MAGTSMLPATPSSPGLRQLQSPSPASKLGPGTRSGSSSPHPSSPVPGSPARTGRGSATARSRIETGPRKRSPAERAEDLCQELLQCLRSEQWRSMRSTNLGVLSGTGVVEELLMRRLQAQVAALHVLVTKHPSAGERLSALGAQLGKLEMQQMQVMLDACGYPELSDYLRVLTYNTADPSATSEVGAKEWVRKAKSTPRGPRRGPADTGARSLQRRAHNADASQLRFAELLPPQHRLANKANNIIEARRQAAEAAAAAEAARRARANLPHEASAEKDDGLGWLRKQQEFLARKMGLLSRHDYVEEVEYHLADVEARWRESVYRSNIAQRFQQGALDHAVILSDGFAPYQGGLGGSAYAAAAHGAPNSAGTVTSATSGLGSTTAPLTTTSQRRPSMGGGTGPGQAHLSPAPSGHPQPPPSRQGTDAGGGASSTPPNSGGLPRIPITGMRKQSVSMAPGTNLSGAPASSSGGAGSGGS